MAKFKPWLKMWVEWLDDLKMLDLTLAEQGAWWRLCTLAQKCAAEGLLVKANGTPLSLDEIIDAVRIKKADRKVFDSMVQKMSDQGSLHWNSTTLVITHFAKRQAKAASETPEAVRDRVRRYRERQRVTDNPLPPLTTPLIQERGDIEEEEEVTPLRNGVTSVTSEPIIAEISKLYEENCGLITPILRQDFEEFCENYRGPIEWIRDAFAEAVKRNKRHWKYIEAILDRWQREGRGPDEKEDKQYGTHRRGDKESSAERLRKSAE